MNPWTDLAVIGAVFGGIFLLGLYGDVVVGWVIFGIVAFVEAIANWTARACRRLRPAQRHRSPGLAGKHPASSAARLP
jgi:hypothetical protein